jgi:short-subunit dehydrogenase involved in D-alanine esterification of teichoic acids
MREPTTIGASGLDTRLEARFSGSGNEVVVSKIQMQKMQQQMNITIGM